MPVVSVIVPNYNHAKFLEKRLETIFNQTLQDFELIFLDDASTDESKEVFTAFADDQHVSAQFNESNSGSPFYNGIRAFHWRKGSMFGWPNQMISQIQTSWKLWSRYLLNRKVRDWHSVNLDMLTKMTSYLATFPIDNSRTRTGGKRLPGVRAR